MLLFFTQVNENDFLLFDNVIHVDAGDNNLPFCKFYCVNPKTVNTRIIFGILLCCKEKANQMQDGKTARCNGN